MNKEFFILWVLIMWAMGASAQSFEEGKLAYKIISIEEHTVEVTTPISTAYSGNITIPSVVSHDGIEYDVVALGEGAFAGSTLTSVKIPSSVTDIKEGCFLFCNGPSTINIPASVQTIGTKALLAFKLVNISVDEESPYFQSINGILYTKDTTTLVQCPVAKSGVITLDTNVRNIADAAFQRCNLVTKIVLPDGLRSIGEQAFACATKLTEMTIPASVEYMGCNLFGSCPALQTITLAEGNTHYVQDGYMILNAVRDTLISYHKSADSVYLPATLKVVSGFLGNTDVKYVHIPSSATTIGVNAFAISSVQHIDMPEQMAVIEGFAFEECTALQSIKMPSTLDSLGEGCFYSCTKLSSIEIPNGLRIIPAHAFDGCPLTTIKWNNEIENIGFAAFANCRIKTLILPTSLRFLDNYSFFSYTKGRKIDRVEFTAPLDSIGYATFGSRKIGLLRLRNTTPPISISSNEQYDVLESTQVDSIMIPCGSKEAYLSDETWGKYADKLVEDCNAISAPTHVQVRLYPNPVQVILSVDGVEGCRRAVVSDIAGVPLLDVPLDGSAEAQLDTSQLPQGIYVLTLHMSEGTCQTTRFVKQ